MERNHLPPVRKVPDEVAELDKGQVIHGRIGAFVSKEGDVTQV